MWKKDLQFTFDFVNFEGKPTDIMHFFNNHSVTKQKKGWSKEEVNRIDAIIRENSPLIELVLFHVAIDTMLRVSDLLKLKVSNVVTKDRGIRDEYIVKQIKTGGQVGVILHPPTREALRLYLKRTRKEQNEYLFQSSKNPQKPFSSWWMRQLVKKWAVSIGLPPEQYSCHSTRRTGAMHLYIQSGKDLEIVRQALGQTSLEATKHYLGIDQDRVKEILRENPLWEM